MRMVLSKFKWIKQDLKKLNPEKFIGVEKKLKQIRQQLHVMQKKMDTEYWNYSLIEEERDLRNQLEKWGGIEESIYK